MKVVILCGGEGTRIRDVSDSLPKPMIPLGNTPILWHIMRHFAHWGHREFVLCLGYQGTVIKNFFLNYAANTQDFTIDLSRPNAITYHDGAELADWRVTLADTGVQAMTGARVMRVRRYLEDEDNFLLTYGDGVSDVDLDALLHFHRQHGRIMTITGVRPPGRFGEIRHDGAGRITDFLEKPQTAQGLISGGFFVCRREIFDYLDQREDLVLELEPMQRLARDGQMALYEHQGFWQCMDTYRDYMQLNDMLRRGDTPWIPGRRGSRS